MGESTNSRAKLRFDRRIRLEFHGATIASDAGLLACRELDDALGLTETSQRLPPQRVWFPRPAQTVKSLPSAFCKSSFHPFREISEVILTIAMKCRRNMSSAAWTGQ